MAETKATDKKDSGQAPATQETTNSRSAATTDKRDAPAPANRESATTKPTTSKAEARGAESSARRERDPESINDQTSGSAGRRGESETMAGVAEGEGYIENEEHVPNPTDQYGYGDTTGAGSHFDAAIVSPYLVKDETVIDTLPEADQVRLREIEPDYAADGSRIVRPEGVNKPVAGDGN